MICPRKRTPLHYAALVGNEKIIAYLLDHGADIEARDQIKRSTLHWAAAYGRPEVCKLLLDRGADKNSEDETGMTAMDYALKWAWNTPWDRNREERQQKVIKILSHQ
ncbi:ankyrin repeat domain-containing protein [bacterium]|nr:ankyrin repeat domain-containing protein [bacterium]